MYRLLGKLMNGVSNAQGVNMLTIGIFVLFLFGLWWLKNTMSTLFKTFREDYIAIRKELLKEQPKPSFTQIAHASITAFLGAMTQSPRNLLLVYLWLSLGVAAAFLFKGVVLLLGILKDFIDFMLSGGRF